MAYIGPVLDIPHGGTGETTASAALNALLPTQTGHNGDVLSTDGSGTVTWESGGAAVISIGSEVVDGVATDVLFVDDDGNLAQNDNFQYTADTQLYIKNTTSSDTNPHPVLELRASSGSGNDGPQILFSCDPSLPVDIAGILAGAPIGTSAQSFLTFSLYNILAGNTPHDVVRFDYNDDVTLYGYTNAAAGFDFLGTDTTGKLVGKTFSTDTDFEDAVAASTWLLTGNNGTTAGTNFVGTTDDIDVVLKRNNTEMLRFATSSIATLTSHFLPGVTATYDLGSATYTWNNLYLAMTAGSIPFVGTGGVLSQDNAALFWDAANDRLGINNVTPGVTLDVTGSANFSADVTIGTTATIGGIINDYNGDTTAGNGVVSIVHRTARPNETNTINDQALFTAPVAGEYRISAYFEVTTTDGSATGDISVDWVDDIGAATKTIIPAISFASTGYYEGSVFIHVAASSVMTFTSTIASNTTGVYSVYVLVERLN